MFHSSIVVYSVSTGILYHVSHVVVSSKHVWTAAKHSPIVRQWDVAKPTIRGEINCSDEMRCSLLFEERGCSFVVDSQYVGPVMKLFAVMLILFIDIVSLPCCCYLRMRLCGLAQDQDTSSSSVPLNFLSFLCYIGANTLYAAWQSPN